jgi:GPN-loop GTPase
MSERKFTAKTLNNISSICSDPSKFISASLLALTMMVHLEMPHINVLSKVDLMEQYGPLPFNLEFFTDLQDMEKLLPYLDAPPALSNAEDEGASAPPPVPTTTTFSLHVRRRRRLHAAMCELIDDFGLVSFETVNIQEAESVGRVLSKIDKSNGYVFGASESNSSAAAKYASKLFSSISTDTEMNAERTLFVQERYGSSRADI